MNFLLGKGERLMEPINPPSGGGPRNAPYTFDDALRRLPPMLQNTLARINELPSLACPRNQAVVSLTLHPEYVAKSYYPSKLLRSVDLEVLGSRPRSITPEKSTRKTLDGESTVTTELFAEGFKTSLANWYEALPDWRPDSREARDLLAIERISTRSEQDKIRGALPSQGQITMEVVLHGGELDARTIVLPQFKQYLDSLDSPYEFGRMFFAKGLSFLALDAPSEKALEIARFSRVRVIRQMPLLRRFEPIVTRETLSEVELQDQSPVSDSVRFAIFDCGIPNSNPLER